MFLRVRAQIADTSQRNYFACEKPELPVPYFWLFQWCLSTPHRLELRTAGPAFITVINKPTRQAMFIQCNTEVHSCSLCCSGKAISTTYSEYVFVALGILHTMQMRCIVICDVSSSNNIFPHYYTNGTIFGGGKEVIEHHNVCFDFVYNFCLKHFSF